MEWLLSPETMMVRGLVVSGSEVPGMLSGITLAGGVLNQIEPARLTSDIAGAHTL
jgi:hypothetical protein